MATKVHIRVKPKLQGGVFSARLTEASGPGGVVNQANDLDFRGTVGRIDLRLSLVNGAGESWAWVDRPPIVWAIAYSDERDKGFLSFIDPANPHDQFVDP